MASPAHPIRPLDRPDLSTRHIRRLHAPVRLLFLLLPLLRQLWRSFEAVRQQVRLVPQNLSGHHANRHRHTPLVIQPWRKWQFEVFIARFLGSPSFARLRPTNRWIRGRWSLPTTCGRTWKMSIRISHRPTCRSTLCWIRTTGNFRVRCLILWTVSKQFYFRHFAF